VVLDADLAIGSDAIVSVAEGLTLNGTATLTNRARLDFAGTEALSTAGHGTINLLGDPNTTCVRETVGGATLTIGRGVTTTGPGGGVGYSGYWGGPSNIAVVNQGVIGANAAGGGLPLTGASWTNAAGATIQATGGGTTGINAASFTNNAGGI